MITESILVIGSDVSGGNTVGSENKINLQNQINTGNNALAQQ
ncbi:MAG TPA: hypothetical protein VFV86_04305 [Nitrososphaeraceae archaeon]|nr:hypothetical protein [Nitrososphaeraceae archaeon]